MKNSSTSSMSKADDGASSVGTTQDCTDQQESGWTSYFDDFSNYINNINGTTDQQHSFATSSVVCDAASYAAWNISKNAARVLPCSSIDDEHILPENLNFMKARLSRKVVADDSLEDTASSPVNSPKVADLIIVDMNQGKTCDDNHFSSSLGKGRRLENNSEVQPDDDQRKQVTSFNGKHEDCVDLKKKGLCLVPLTMLVKYLG